ncbi:hypothetical protein [Hymenobacter jeollabukensis]|nr:hypothetical protein [Hymenobacter jeollabukensis]
MPKLLSFLPLLLTGQSPPAAYVFRQGQKATNYGNGRGRTFYWAKPTG